MLHHRLSPADRWLRLRALSLALLAWAFVAFPIPALADVLPVRADEVGPTQMEIGQTAATIMVSGWRAQAAKANMPFAQWASEVLKPQMASKVLPGVVDPHGKVRVTDGHHRVWALLQVQKETGVDFGLSVEVGDPKAHAAKSDAAFAASLHQSGKMYVTPPVRVLPPAEQLARLPRTFAEIRDNPLRSAVGTVLYRAGIDSADFVDYLEFHAGERAVSRGLLASLSAKGLIPPGATALPTGAETREVVLAEVHAYVLGEAGRKYLVEAARPGKEPGILEKLAVIARATPRVTAAAAPAREGPRHGTALPAKVSLVASPAVPAIAPPIRPAPRLPSLPSPAAFAGAHAPR
jgi:hypothetical protein